jgi:hypothetical protein
MYVTTNSRLYCNGWNKPPSNSIQFLTLEKISDTEVIYFVWGIEMGSEHVVVNNKCMRYCVHPKYTGNWNI